MLNEFIGVPAQDTRPQLQPPRRGDRCFLDWCVVQQRLPASPLHRPDDGKPISELPFLFDVAQARELLTAAAGCPTTRGRSAADRSIHCIFALCYGLGLRAAEACALRLGDVDGTGSSSSWSAASSAKVVWSRTDHASAPCWAARSTGDDQRARRLPDAPMFSFDNRRSIHPGTASQTFHHPSHRPGLSRSLTASPHRACTACATRSPWAACCAGIGKGSIRRPGCSSCRPLWDTSTRPRPRST